MANPHLAWPEHALTLTGAPSALVSTSDIKTHCRVFHDDDDAYLASLVSVATAMLDGPYGIVGKAIATQTWTLHQGPIFAQTRLNLPVLPFRSVTSISYYDADNVQQSATLSDFTIFGNEDFGYIEPVTAWPVMYDRPDALEIVFAAGYGDPAQCPANLVHAVKCLVAHWYEKREAAQEKPMSEIPFGVMSLVNINRIGWAAS